MGPAYAAVGAGVAALFEATVASRFHIADAQLQIVLVLAIVITIAFSLESAMAWAFVGGVFVDLLVARPLGSAAFCLLIAVGGTAAMAHYLPFGKLAISVVSVFVWTLAYLVLNNWLVGFLRPPAYPLHLTSLFWAALVNAALAAVALVVARYVGDRLERRRRVVW
jgi:cell shape-determining protein MreD